MLPLEGLRVIDLGRVWSGPLTTRILGDFGADVIKVESLAGRGEFTGASSRQNTLPWEFPGQDPGEHPWNRASMFNDLNRNKRSLTLNLTKPEGVGVFKKLLAVSDIVVENYTPRVMANFGLDYKKLQAINPRIIMLSMPAYGMYGPYSEFPGYGNTIEPVAGITQLTGYYGERPQPLGMIAGDALAALHGVSALMVAIRHRRLTGEGQYIDLSQSETQTSIIGSYVLGFQMTHDEILRHGNSHAAMAPHGCYRCLGDDAWVAIAMATDVEWHNFCKVMMNPPWTNDPRFASLANRMTHQDELDKLIESWTLKLDHYAVMYLLQAAGIAAGPVLNGREILADPHLNQKGFFVEIPHLEAGTFKYAGMPVTLSRTPAEYRLPAPCLGEHNQSVLADLLKIDPAEIENLKDKQVIGTLPPGVSKS